MARTQENSRMEGKLCISGLDRILYQQREPGFVFAGESHPTAELIYVDQGSLHSVAEGRDLLLEQGELMFFGPNQWHMHYADMDMAPRYASISFSLEGLDIAPLLNRKLAPPPQVTALLRQLLQEQEQMEAYAADMIISQLRLILLILLRQQSSPRSEKTQPAGILHSDHVIIRQAQQYISNHVREKMTVPSVARQVDVSPSYLTALFHKHLQISPGEYIRRVKLQESKLMIRENSLNFTEIAAQLQYSTVHHFSRQFKEKFGMTPTEYARSVR